jgi:tyrosyl-tRNA synthetase
VLDRRDRPMARVFHTSISAPTHPALSGTPLQRGFRTRRSESPLPRGVARRDGVGESATRGCEICGLAGIFNLPWRGRLAARGNGAFRQAQDRPSLPPRFAPAAARLIGLSDPGTAKFPLVRARARRDNLRPAMNLLEDLQWRDLIADCTDLDGLGRRLAGGPITLYCGFDPTGDSLHAGHLMGQLTLRRFQLAGHHPIPLAGGATGMIGDPGGRSAERNLLSREELAHNAACIKRQLSKFIDFESTTNPARLVDNADWTSPVSYIDFLRDVGKHFSVNVMLAKDSVRSRLESSSGLSYTEFSYMLLQAFDFLHLREAFGCELQIGGSDQYGNIVAGCDLIRKKLGLPAWGLTFPLITDAAGQKFGKSTGGGSVWLDPAKTSPYRFYQYFINTGDEQVAEYLRKFTLLPREPIEALVAEHARNPGARAAQRTLAREVTTLVHGASACDDAVRASAIMFGGELEGISESLFTDAVGEVPTTALDPAALSGAGTPVIDLVVRAGLAPSKGQARKDVEAGGIYLNNARVTEIARTATTSDLLFGKYLLLRKGKRTYAVLNAR